MGIDATASAALDAAVIKPVYFAFVDFENEPVRVNTSGADVSFTGTGIAELDGFTFSGLRADAVDIGPVANKSAGTDSLLITLSGLQGLDDDMLAEIADPAHWRGREIRLWRVIRNAANVQQGGIQHYYTGNMTTLSLSSKPDGQTIAVTVESYIAAYAAASNRSYLDQARYDAGDESARASIDIANNGGGSPGGNVSSTSGGGSGGGRRNAGGRELQF